MLLWEFSLNFRFSNKVTKFFREVPGALTTFTWKFPSTGRFCKPAWTNWTLIFKLWYVCLLEDKNTLSERISTHCARCQRRKAIRKSSIFRVRPRRANEQRLRMHTFRFNEKPVCTVLYGLELFSNFTRILITIVTLLSYVLKYIYSGKTTKI